MRRQTDTSSASNGQKARTGAVVLVFPHKQAVLGAFQEEFCREKTSAYGGERELLPL